MIGCLVEECPRDGDFARGWCAPHYKRWYRYGGPLGTPPPGPTWEEKYIAKIDVRGPDECWPWLGSKFKKGYGRFSMGPKKVQAHVFGWTMNNGPMPDGLVVDHTCHNGSGCPGGVTCLHRACQNPAHWEAVTAAENTSRGEGGRYQREKTHCPKGHEYTEENTYHYKGGRSCIQCNTDRQQSPEGKAYSLAYTRQRRARLKEESG